MARYKKLSSRLVAIAETLAPEGSSLSLQYQYIDGLADFYCGEPELALVRLEKIRSKIHANAIGTQSLASVDLFLGELSLQTRGVDLANADMHFRNAAKLGRQSQDKVSEMRGQTGRAHILSLTGQFAFADELLRELLAEELPVDQELDLLRLRSRLLQAISLKMQGEWAFAEQTLRSILADTDANHLSDAKLALKARLLLADVLRQNKSSAIAWNELDAILQEPLFDEMPSGFHDEFHHLQALCALEDHKLDEAKSIWSRLLSATKNKLVQARCHFFLAEADIFQVRYEDSGIRDAEQNYNTARQSHDAQVSDINERLKAVEDTFTPEAHADLVKQYDQLKSQHAHLTDRFEQIQESIQRYQLNVFDPLVKRALQHLDQAVSILGEDPVYPSLQYLIRCRLGDLTLAQDASQIARATKIYREAASYAERPIEGTDLDRRDWMLYRYRYPFERLVELGFRANEFAASFQYADQSRSRRFHELAEGLCDDGLAHAMHLTRSQTAKLQRVKRIQDASLSESQIDTQLESLKQQLEQFDQGNYSTLGRQMPQVQYAQDDLVLGYYIGEACSYVFWRPGDADVWKGAELSYKNRLLRWDDLSRQSRSGAFRKRVGLVPEFIELVSDPQTSNQDVLENDTAHTLSKALLPEALRQDLAFQKQRGKGRVHIFPFGPLFHFPFEVLPLSAGSFLCEASRPILYSPTAGLLSMMRERKELSPTASGIMTVGLGQTVNRSDGSEFKVGAETPNIAERFRAANVPVTEHFGQVAELADIISSMRGSRWIHFGTHASRKQEDERQLGEDDLRHRSSISILHLPDGKALSDQQVRQQDLSADFVALAACQTGMILEGINDVNDCDPSHTLAGAFLISGAQRVLASHWLVGAEGTSHYMESVFGRIAETIPRNEPIDYASIIAQQRQAFRQKFPQYDRPFYWAPFTLQVRTVE